MMSLRRVVLVAVGLAMASGFAARQAEAIPPFLKEFQARYVNADLEDEQNQEFAKLVNEATKCNVCHVQGKEKKIRNPYGNELAKRLKKDDFSTARLKAEPEECTEEIVAAFEAVAALKSAGDESPTFGELLAGFKLPGDVKPVEVAATDKPMPDAPMPADDTPASAPSGDAEAALAAVKQIGGSVMQLAQSDDSLVVSFHLGGTSLDDEGLAQIQRLPKVVELNLKDTQITDEGLAHVAPITTLVKLHLEKTKVTDEGLAHLKELGNLEYLNVYGTAVSDAGLEHLQGLKNLKKLYVWQTQVTDEGIAKLKEALPDVTVVK